jgi:tRNA (mo5U34)-methyltransferase
MNLAQTRMKLEAIPWMRRPVKMAQQCKRFLFGESPISEDELRTLIPKIRWFHSIDLGNGIVTNCKHPTPRRLSWLGMPENLSGMTVLDVGAWDGFFSFEAEKRGARRVLATDSFCWSSASAKERWAIYRRVINGESTAWSAANWSGKVPFNLAHRALRSGVESREMDVLDLSPQRVGKFDLVLFLSVLYHMRHPLLALERVFSVTRGQLILESHVDMLDYARPAAAFYPGRELGNDETNWFGPNPSMIAAMLKEVGFRKVRLHWGPQENRVVFHAWRDD